MNSRNRGSRRGPRTRRGNISPNHTILIIPPWSSSSSSHMCRNSLVTSYYPHPHFPAYMSRKVVRNKGCAGRSSVHNGSQLLFTPTSALTVVHQHCWLSVTASPRKFNYREQTRTIGHWSIIITDPRTTLRLLQCLLGRGRHEDRGDAARQWLVLLLKDHHVRS